MVMDGSKKNAIRYRIGLKVPDTIEFVEFEFERDVRGLEAQLSA